MTVLQKVTNWKNLLLKFRKHFSNLANFDARGAVICPFARIQGGERIELSKGVFVSNYATLMTVSAGEKTERDAFLRIGEGTYIGECSNIRAAGADVLIGRNVMVANNSVIVSSNHGIAAEIPISEQKYVDCEKPVVIEDGAWLGAGVSVLAGVRIGRGAVIASGAVVNQAVGPNEIWGGVPARLISKRK